MTVTDFMRMALDACKRGVEASQTPLGACIVRDGEILANEHNVVWQTTDIMKTLRQTVIDSR